MGKCKGSKPVRVIFDGELLDAIRAIVREELDRGEPSTES